MKKLLICTLAFAAPAAFAIGNEEVCFYEHANHNGAKICRSLTDRPTALLFDYGWDNRVSSVDLGKDVSVELFENDSFTGARWFFTDITYNLGGANDRATSYRIQRKNAPRACIYEHINFEGQYQCFPVSGERQTVDLLGMGWNDKVSSVRVDPGMIIIGYDHINSGGFGWIYDVNTPNLNAQNDRLSSLELMSRNKQVCLYEHANYQGQKMCWDFNGSKIDIPWLGNFNDMASSLKVPPGAKLTAYTNAYYGNKIIDYSGDVPWLGEHNDSFSSISISSDAR